MAYDGKGLDMQNIYKQKAYASDAINTAAKNSNTTKKLFGNTTNRIVGDSKARGNKYMIQKEQMTEFSQLARSSASEDGIDPYSVDKPKQLSPTAILSLRESGYTNTLLTQLVKQNAEPAGLKSTLQYQENVLNLLKSIDGKLDKKKEPTESREDVDRVDKQRKTSKLAEAILGGDLSGVLDSISSNIPALSAAKDVLDNVKMAASMLKETGGIKKLIQDQAINTILGTLPNQIGEHLQRFRADAGKYVQDMINQTAYSKNSALRGLVRGSYQDISLEKATAKKIDMKKEALFDNKFYQTVVEVHTRTLYEIRDAIKGNVGERYNYSEQKWTTIYEDMVKMNQSTQTVTTAVDQMKNMMSLLAERSLINQGGVADSGMSQIFRTNAYGGFEKDSSGRMQFSDETAIRQLLTAMIKSGIDTNALVGGDVNGIINNFNLRSYVPKELHTYLPVMLQGISQMFRSVSFEDRDRFDNLRRQHVNNIERSGLQYAQMLSGYDPNTIKEINDFITGKIRYDDISVYDVSNTRKKGKVKPGSSNIGAAIDAISMNANTVYLNASSVVYGTDGGGGNGVVSNIKSAIKGAFNKVKATSSVPDDISPKKKKSKRREFTPFKTVQEVQKALDDPKANIHEITERTSDELFDKLPETTRKLFTAMQGKATFGYSNASVVDTTVYSDVKSDIKKMSVKDREEVAKRQKEDRINAMINNGGISDFELIKRYREKQLTAEDKVTIDKSLDKYAKANQYFQQMQNANMTAGSMAAYTGGTFKASDYEKMGFVRDAAQLIQFIDDNGELDIKKLQARYSHYDEEMFKGIQKEHRRVLDGERFDPDRPWKSVNEVISNIFADTKVSKFTGIVGGGATGYAIGKVLQNQGIVRSPLLSHVLGTVGATMMFFGKNRERIENILGPEGEYENEDGVTNRQIFMAKFINKWVPALGIGGKVGSLTMRAMQQLGPIASLVSPFFGLTTGLIAGAMAPRLMKLAQKALFDDDGKGNKGVLKKIGNFLRKFDFVKKYFTLRDDRTNEQIDNDVLKGMISGHQKDIDKMTNMLNDENLSEEERTELIERIAKKTELIAELKSFAEDLKVINESAKMREDEKEAARKERLEKVSEGTKKAFTLKQETERKQRDFSQKGKALHDYKIMGARERYDTSKADTMQQRVDRFMQTLGEEGATKQEEEFIKQFNMFFSKGYTNEDIRYQIGKEFLANALERHKYNRSIETGEELLPDKLIGFGEMDKFNEIVSNKDLSPEEQVAAIRDWYAGLPDETRNKLGDIIKLRRSINDSMASAVERYSAYLEYTNPRLAQNKPKLLQKAISELQWMYSTDAFVQDVANIKDISKAKMKAFFFEALGEGGIVKDARSRSKSEEIVSALYNAIQNEASGGAGSSTPSATVNDIGWRMKDLGNEKLKNGTPLNIGGCALGAFNAALIKLGYPPLAASDMLSEANEFATGSGINAGFFAKMASKLNLEVTQYTVSDNTFTPDNFKSLVGANTDAVILQLKNTDNEDSHYVTLIKYGNTKCKVRDPQSTNDSVEISTGGIISRLITVTILAKPNTKSLKASTNTSKVFNKVKDEAKENFLRVLKSTTLGSMGVGAFSLAKKMMDKSKDEDSNSGLVATNLSTGIRERSSDPVVERLDNLINIFKEGPLDVNIAGDETVALTNTDEESSKAALQMSMLNAKSSKAKARIQKIKQLVNKPAFQADQAKKEAVEDAILKGAIGGGVVSTAAQVVAPRATEDGGGFIDTILSLLGVKALGSLISTGLGAVVGSLPAIFSAIGTGLAAASGPLAVGVAIIGAYYALKMAKKWFMEKFGMKGVSDKQDEMQNRAFDNGFMDYNDPGATDDHARKHLEKLKTLKSEFDSDLANTKGDPRKMDALFRKWSADSMEGGMLHGFTAQQMADDLNNQIFEAQKKVNLNDKADKKIDDQIKADAKDLTKMNALGDSINGFVNKIKNSDFVTGKGYAYSASMGLATIGSNDGGDSETLMDEFKIKHGIDVRSRQIMDQVLGLSPSLVSKFGVGTGLSGSWTSMMDNEASPNDIKSIITKAASVAGTDPTLMLGIATQESALKPTAWAGYRKNGNHRYDMSARGLFQFTNQTWRHVVKKYAKKIGAKEEDLLRGMETDQDPRYNPVLNSLMAAYHLKDMYNIAKKDLGREPTPEEVYMYHGLGVGGAPIYLKSGRDSDAVQVALSHKSTANQPKYNQSMFYEKDGSPRTIKSLIGWYRDKLSKAIEKATGKTYNQAYKPEYPLDMPKPEIKLGEKRALEYAGIMQTLPVSGSKSNLVVTSAFGPRNVPKGSRNHKGIDIRAKAGAPIYATHDAKVLTSQASWGMVELKDPNTGVVTRYLHMNDRLVKPGDIVKAGDQIGTSGGVGKSGKKEFNDHLHYEVRDAKNEPLDPFKVLDLSISNLKPGSPENDAYARRNSMIPKNAEIGGPDESFYIEKAKEFNKNQTTSNTTNIINNAGLEAVIAMFAKSMQAMTNMFIAEQQKTTAAIMHLATSLADEKSNNRLLLEGAAMART